MPEQKITNHDIRDTQPFEANFESAQGDTHRESHEKPLFDKIEERLGLNPSDANLLPPKRD